MSDSESIEEDVQAGYPAEVEQESTLSHLNPDEVEGVMTFFWDIGLPVGATLEYLQANHKNGYFFEIPADMKSKMRHIARANNRSNASDDDGSTCCNRTLRLRQEVGN
jgi:hypothetical protein